MPKSRLKKMIEKFVGSYRGNGDLRPTFFLDLWAHIEEIEI